MFTYIVCKKYSKRKGKAQTIEQKTHNSAKRSKLSNKTQNSSKKLKVSGNSFGRVAENRSKLEAWVK